MTLSPNSIFSEQLNSVPLVFITISKTEMPQKRCKIKIICKKIIENYLLQPSRYYALAMGTNSGRPDCQLAVHMVAGKLCVSAWAMMSADVNRPRETNNIRMYTNK